MVKLTAFVVFNFLVLFTVSSGHDIPNNPCPEFFTYEIIGTDVAGLVTIPFDGLPIHLEVEASMKGLYSKQQSIMSISLLNDADDLLRGTSKFVRYRIGFPIQTSIPQITLIRMNGNDLCEGPKLVLSDLSCTSTKLKYTHNYPSNSMNRQKRQEQPGILEVMPEGNEYFYPLICVEYDQYTDDTKEEEEGEEGDNQKEKADSGEYESDEGSFSSETEETSENLLNEETEKPQIRIKEPKSRQEKQL